jgi:hypothetical protein
MTRRIAALIAALLSPACGAVEQLEFPGGNPPVLYRGPTLAPNRVPRPNRAYRFMREEKQGDSPTFDVVDADGGRWEVKLGVEAHTETAAAQLLDRAGYFVEEYAYFDRVRIDDLPRLSRGNEFISHGEVAGARFERRRDDVVRATNWEWANNPFVGTRELDALRVLMVLINNYDARASKNRILLLTGANGSREARYVVDDLGASFGQYGGLGGTRTKGDAQGYTATTFVAAVKQDTVDTVQFGYRTAPEGWATATFVLNPFYAAGELKKQREMHEAPVAAARWIGARLSTIPPVELNAIFESAGYDVDTARAFASEVSRRIAALGVL